MGWYRSFFSKSYPVMLNAGVRLGLLPLYEQARPPVPMERASGSLKMDRDDVGDCQGSGGAS